MQRLKADFHTHSGDDPRDDIEYSSETLIDSVAQCGVDVLAITCHEANVYTERLARYAAARNVLLIPGMEMLIEGVHVVCLNPDSEQEQARTFDDLRALGRRDAVFIAPHAFFPIDSALKEKLIEHIDLFDAVEYCTMYCTGINFNRRAEQVAQRFDLPMVGTSDTHVMPYADSTISWIEAERSVDGVLDALRSGRVEVETRPRPPMHIANMMYYTAHGMVRDRFAAVNQ
jgi:hypothetical protein